jgi:ABC-type multidrug transport system ATPase subunit
LKQCYGAGLVQAKANNLLSEIRAGGDNLGMGERQVICLARAIVRRARIVVMDEATASVDMETDSKIQRTLRGEAFSGATMILIAHRIQTIIDSDKIMVLDQGELIEFDSPRRLLEDSTGMFRQTVEASENAGYLKDIAFGRVDPWRDQHDSEILSLDNLQTHLAIIVEMNKDHLKKLCATSGLDNSGTHEALRARLSEFHTAQWNTEAHASMSESVRLKHDVDRREQWAEQQRQNIVENTAKEAAKAHIRRSHPELAELTAPALRVLLSKLELDTRGKKAVLIERLAQALEQDLYEIENLQLVPHLLHGPNPGLLLDGHEIDGSY